MNTTKRPVGRPRIHPKPEPKPKGDGLRRAAARAASGSASKSYAYPIKPPDIPAGVVPAGQTAPVMAMDDNRYSYVSSLYNGTGGFPGFPYLAQLATRAEYRAFASTLSTELTREWIEFTSKQDDDTSTADKIKLIEDEFKRLNVREVMRMAAEHDSLFGRGQIFITIRDADNDTPLVLSPNTVKKGSFERLSAVEAVWTTPSAYNTLDPTAPDFYKPRKWFMLGKQVHASRLITIVTRPLPDILKPAFNFAGMSLSQLAEPYVDNWLRTRQSVADLINNFSTTVLQTDMGQILSGEDDNGALMDRASLFTATRSNKGLMLLDKEREELVQINTPLSGLHELQAQSQEHMCSVSRMPAIVLTGISPSGLNASSDGEIRVFYDWISAQQEAFWREPMETILKCVQLSLFGEIDPDIGFTFVPLYQMTPEQEADIRAKDGATDCAYITAGVLDPTEVRERIAKDPNSGHMGLDVSKEIIAPGSDPADELDPAEDASVSEAQHRAMEAAAHGHSMLGIPEKVGKEFVSKDGWITVHPNGPDSKGQPAFVGEGGVIEKGMGGKFNGQKISEIHKNFTGPVDKSKKEVNNLPTSTNQPEKTMAELEIKGGSEKQNQWATSIAKGWLNELETEIANNEARKESEGSNWKLGWYLDALNAAKSALNEGFSKATAKQVIDLHQAKRNPVTAAIAKARNAKPS